MRESSRSLSKLLSENIAAALAGTGAVVPIFAGYDAGQEAAKIYFYDISRCGVRRRDYAYPVPGHRLFEEFFIS